MNRKLSQGFKKHCDGEYHRIEDDGYIYTYLAKHMVDGKEFAELSKLLRSIQWIIKKVGLLGPANMLNDYVSYKDFVPAKVSINPCSTESCKSQWHTAEFICVLYRKD